LFNCERTEPKSFYFERLPGLIHECDRLTDHEEIFPINAYGKPAGFEKFLKRYEKAMELIQKAVRIDNQRQAAMQEQTDFYRKGRVESHRVDIPKLDFCRPWDQHLVDSSARNQIRGQPIANLQVMPNAGCRLFERWEYHVRSIHHWIDVSSHFVSYFLIHFLVIEFT
jgi:hypothetical protein